jgi:hypothetical protein
MPGRLVWSANFPYTLHPTPHTPFSVKKAAFHQFCGSLAVEFAVLGVRRGSRFDIHLNESGYRFPPQSSETLPSTSVNSLLI